MWHWLVMGCLAAGQVETPAARGLLFDRVVAWVDGETVTQTELVAEASLQLVMDHGVEASALSEIALQSALRTLVGDLLVAREARRVGAEMPVTEVVEKKFAALLDQFPSQEAYGSFVHQLGVDDSFVLDSITRTLLIEAYLSQRLRTRLLHDEPKASDVSSSTARAREKEREQRFLGLVVGYRQDLWKSVPVRLLRPNGQLERVTAP